MGPASAVHREQQQAEVGVEQARRAESAGRRTAARRWRRALLLAVAAALLVLVAPPRAHAAEVVHVVSRGHTLGAIARRYHTTVKVIEKANRLKPGAHIYPGQKLRIPVRASATRSRAARSRARGKAAARPRRTSAKHAPPPPKASGAASRSSRKAASSRRRGARRTRSGSAPKDPFARRPVRPGHVTLMRFSERFEGQLVDEQRRVLPAARRRVSKLLRDLRTRMQVHIDDRLLQTIADISDHFGARPMVVVSGFRLYSTHQHTPHSRHNHGRAIDFRIVGVPNEVLRDYCMSLAGVGVGYYPNSTFVHLDTRPRRATWIDYSRPGKAPRYAKKQRRRAARRAKDQGASAPGRSSNATRASAPQQSAGKGKPRAGTPAAAAKPSQGAAPRKRPAARGRRNRGASSTRPRSTTSARPGPSSG